MTMINGNLNTRETIEGGLDTRFSMSGNMTAGVGGTSDYNELDNKPSINGVTLEGNVSGADIGIYPPVDYSTSPQKLNTKWIDGKEIWCKTIIGNFSTGNLIIDTIIPSLVNIIKFDGFLYYAPNNQWLAIPYGESGDCVTLLTRNNDIILYSTSSMSSYSRYIVTIYYTKG